MAAKIMRDSMYRHMEQQRAENYRKMQAHQQQAALNHHVNYINSLPNDPESIKIRGQAMVETAKIFLPLYLISIASLLPVLVIGFAGGSNRTMLRASASSGGLMTVLSCYFWYQVFWVEKNQKKIGVIF